MAGLGAVALMPTGRRRASKARPARMSYVGHASFLIQTAGLNILLDPVWSKRASPFRFVGTEARQRSGHRLCRSAADRCRAGVARPLRSSRSRDAVAACGRASPARHHAARQRHHHAQSRSGDRGRRPTTGTIASISARRGGDAGADAALVGAQPVRPQHVAVGVVRDRDAGRADLFRRRFRLRRRRAISATRASATDRSGSPSCRSAPTSRAGSCATST